MKLSLLIEGLWFLKKVCRNFLWLSDFSLVILLHSHSSCLCYKSQVEEQYPDTLDTHNCDNKSFLLLEFFSAAFSLLLIILQTNSFSQFQSFAKGNSWGKNQLTLVIYNVQN